MQRVDGESPCPSSVGRFTYATHLCFRSVASVVDVHPYLEGIDHVLCTTEVIGMLMGDPKEIDGTRPEVASQRGHQVAVLLAAVVALRAAGVVASVDQDVSPIREIDERRERLPHVVEVHGHPPPARAMR